MHDIRPLIFNEPQAATPYHAFYYCEHDPLQAVRSGRWKLFLPLDSVERPPHFHRVASGQPLLLDLVADVGCLHNVAAEQSAQVARLLRLAELACRDLGDRDLGDRGLGDRGQPGAGQGLPGRSLDAPGPLRR